jgi:hypothetical protein
VRLIRDKRYLARCARRAWIRAPLTDGQDIKVYCGIKDSFCKATFASSGAVSELIEVRDEVCDALVASSVGLEIDTRSV